MSAVVGAVSSGSEAKEPVSALNGDGESAVLKPRDLRPTPRFGDLFHRLHARAGGFCTSPGDRAGCARTGADGARFGAAFHAAP
jgi:hypothetical protein